MYDWLCENWIGMVILGVALIVGTFVVYTKAGKNKPY